METTPPLTPDMQAALARLVRTQSTALVRVISQWWAAEGDVRDGVPYPPAGSGHMFPTCEMWPTRTVQGLVDRGVLRYKKPARNHHNKVVPHRAEFDRRHRP